jgi:hypothetical protein
MVQVPGASSIAIDADTLQMVGVVEVKLTGRRELAVAVTPTNVFTQWAGMAPKVIVWTSPLTVKLCVTAGAAA